MIDTTLGSNYRNNYYKLSKLIIIITFIVGVLSSTQQKATLHLISLPVSPLYYY